MKKITPYINPQVALDELDNGGRFYNLLSKPNDGNVSTAELAKVAGVFNDKQQMVLYLEMSIANLDENQVKEITESLSKNLFKTYQENKPQLLSIFELKNAELSTSVLIEGTPKYTTSKDNFSGFIMVPVHGGGMIMIPIIEQYDVYKIEDENNSIFIAHTKGKEKLPNEKVKLGGVIKEMKMDKEGRGQNSRYIEIQYYSEL